MQFSTTPNKDICDLSRIYDDSFSYSLPKKDLETFFSGKAFDYQDFYSSEEAKNLRADINEIFNRILVLNPDHIKIAVMTAGAPGAGKTVLMRQNLEEQRTDGRHFAYICPDDVCLKQQIRTYVAEIDNETLEKRIQAYTKWRPGSNAANHVILANLIKEGFAFYFGTTCSSPHTNKFFNFLKLHNYKIRVIHASAPDDVRWESIKERDKTFVQTTEKDVKEKGDLPPQRIHDTFLALADEIDFYFRSDVKGSHTLAAKWTRLSLPSEKPMGTLNIVNRAMYENVRTIQDAVAKKLGRPDLELANSLEIHSNIVYPKSENIGVQL